MRKIRFLTILLLAFIALTSCNTSGDNSDGTTENGGGDESSLKSNATFDVGERVYVVTDGSLDVSNFGIDKMIGYAIGESCVSFATDDMPKEQNEIAVGSCDREISTIGYSKLSAVSRESNNVIRYGIYSSGESVAVVYDNVVGLEKQIVSCAFEFFRELYVKENSPIKIESGEFKSSSISISALQEMKNSDLWIAFESAVGTEIATNLKKMHSDLYSDEIIDFIASLYDNNYGGFYYSSTIRDQLGYENNGIYQYYLPDVESTLNAISFIEKSGMICGFDGIKDALPVWMYDQINRFASENKDDVPKQDDVSESVIDQLNSSCDPISGLWSEGLDLSAPSDIIDLVEIYSIYERFGASIAYPEKAVNSIVALLKTADNSSSDIGIYYAWKAICAVTTNLEKYNPETLTDVRKTLLENGAEIIGVTKNYIKGRICSDGSFSSSDGDENGNIISTVILSTEINECIFASFGSPAITLYTREDLQRFITEVSKNRVLYTYTPSDKFYQSGAVNYKIYTYKNADGTDEPAIFIYNAKEYEGEKLHRAIIYHIVTSDDGVQAGLSLDKLDNYCSVIFEGKFSYNYASSESDIKEAYINYKITPYSSKATVLRIYNSYLIKDEVDMREILTHLIISEEGVKADLSLGDIDYYITEWKAHNIMYKNPSVIPFMNKDEVMERAKHVDLNTDDSYASIYSSLVSMYG